MSLIEISDLSKTYGHGAKSVAAMHHVSLNIEAGEIFGIIGRSGAGKSTLIRCLNRLETPTWGKIVIDGQELTALSETELRLARREIGMIFQHFNLLSSRTVAGNIAFPMEISGKPRAQIKTRIEELLELVGLTDKANAYPAQLSGGQKQRVGIARALANNPKVLLCDEATSALDPQTTQSILTLIHDIKNRLGLTVVLITHEMKVITEICDRVAVMDEGRIVESGPVIKVFSKPIHPVTKSFVQSFISRDTDTDTSNYKPRGTMVRVFFVGEAADESLISNMIKRFNVEANIQQGYIDHIKGMGFGTLLIDLIGEREDRSKAMAYLHSMNQILEVVDDVN